MKSLTIYTTQACPHCARAKDLLRRKKIPFTEIDVSDDAKRREVQDRYGWLTVPIVVIGDKCIGGAEELYRLERSGELDPPS